MVDGTKESIDLHAQRMSVKHTYGGRCCFIEILFNMLDKKNEAGTLLPILVTEGVTVNVLPNGRHEYVMDSGNVASGYGVTKYNIRQHLLQHRDELIEGKHFVKGVSIPNTPTKQPHQVWWTKRGIVRLGFYIKSERAKLFRDWAEELIVKIDEVAIHHQAAIKTLPSKRNHNRLTQERLISILADVCRIEDKELRLSITNKLMGGAAL